LVFVKKEEIVNEIELLVGMKRPGYPGCFPQYFSSAILVGDVTSTLVIAEPITEPYN
jgi:hypothetical protein